MSVDSGMGNYAGDSDLEAIENETLPGTNNVKKIIGSLRQRLAQDNPVNTDTNINRTERVDVSTPPKAQTPLESLGLGEGFSTPVDYTLPTSLASVSKLAEETSTGTAPMMPVMPQDPSAASVTAPGGVPMDNPASGVVMSSFNSIAYVIENGEVKCASCENYYIPESEAHIKSAHCGAPECHDARTEEEMKDAEGVWTAAKLPEDVEEGDVVHGKMIKTTDEETRLASTNDYLAAFEKTASDSQLYYRGYEDAKSGRPLDEDLAELSDDYFHGYDQFKFYHISPQNSVPQNLYDIKPNSNNNPRERLTQGEADLGLNELTDGHGFATAFKNADDNLKEAGPLDFAHTLQQTEQYKRQQRNNLLMNMGFMQPAKEQAESVKKQTDAVCQMCETLGHKDDHSMHESTMPQTTPKFNSGGPGGFEMGKFTDTHQELPIGIVSSKLPFPTDVIESFFED